MTSIDAFNKIVSTVFTVCYERFPLNASFEVSDFFSEDEKIEGLPDGKDASDVFCDSFHWLLKYGYIDCNPKDINIYEALFIELTEKSLTILNCMPSSLEPKTTLAQKLSDAVKSGSKESITETVRQIVQCGFKLIPTII